MQRIVSLLPKNRLDDCQGAVVDELFPVGEDGLIGLTHSNTITIIKMKIKEHSIKEPNSQKLKLML